MAWLSGEADGYLLSIWRHPEFFSRVHRTILSEKTWKA